MKIKEACERNLTNVICKATAGIDKIETDIDDGMKFVLKYIQQKENFYIICVDFQKFEEYNVPFMKANYYDSNGVACKRWIDQRWYGSTDKSNILIYVDGNDDIFEISDSQLYNEYLIDESKLSYIEWLENEIMEMRNK